MSARRVVVSTVGFQAFRALKNFRIGRVFGNTSAGLFLQLDSRWIVFVTNQPVQGPLTVNLTGELTGLNQIQAGNKFLLGEGSIRFPDQNVYLELGGARVWKSPPLPTAVLPVIERHRRLKDVALRLAKSSPDSEIGGLLPVIVGVITPTDLLPNSRNLWQKLAILETALVTGNYSTFHVLESLIGLGNGLTPTGDDLISGFLLAVNRWSLKTNLDVDQLNRQVIDMAYRRTTLLSANLIECAGLGEADERLVSALDGVMSGNRALETCCDDLLGWGHSSGVASFLGMALAIK